MKTIVAISDTHNHCVSVPPGDLLIHAGDATETGQVAEFASLNQWFESTSHATILYTPGNHDRLFQCNRLRAQSIVPKAICLIDELIVVHGLRIYGSPWAPVFEEWPFMLTEDELKEKWAQIPEGLDILITHSPPYGILDFGWGAHYGSTSLSHRLKEMKHPPKLHFFGHIHPGYGSLTVGETTHYNVSICDDEKQPARKGRL